MVGGQGGSVLGSSYDAYSLYCVSYSIFSSVAEVLKGMEGG